LPVSHKALREAICIFFGISEEKEKKIMKIVRREAVGLCKFEVRISKK
jgi:hypothetical protein